MFESALQTSALIALIIGAGLLLFRSCLKQFGGQDPRQSILTPTEVAHRQMRKRLRLLQVTPSFAALPTGGAAQLPSGCSFQIHWAARSFQIMKSDVPENVLARLFTSMLLGVSFCGFRLLVAVRPALTTIAAPAFRGSASLVPPIVTELPAGSRRFPGCAFIGRRQTWL